MELGAPHNDVCTETRANQDNGSPPTCKHRHTHTHSHSLLFLLSGCRPNVYSRPKTAVNRCHTMFPSTGGNTAQLESQADGEDFGPEEAEAVLQCNSGDPLRPPSPPRSWRCVLKLYKQFPVSFPSPVLSKRPLPRQTIPTHNSFSFCVVTSKCSPIWFK